MILILSLLPFLILLFSFLVLFNAGRNLKEKLTIFLLNPDDVPKGSSGLMAVLRIIFWISFFLSAWIIIGILRHKR
jgi:hypothetical protein